MQVTNPTIAVDSATLAHEAAKTLRDQMVSAAKWPAILAKRLFDAITGGWRKSYGTFSEMWKSIPSIVRSVQITSAFSTEGGYERIRTGVQAGATWFGKAFGWAARKTAWLLSMPLRGLANAVRTVNTDAGDKIDAFTNKALVGFYKTYQAVSRVYTVVVANVFTALGHRFAVKWITGGAFGLTMLLFAELLSMAGVHFNLISTTLSGFLSGTPLLAGLSIIPAIFTSTGVVGVTIGVIVVSGGVTAWLFNRREINEMIAADAAFAAETDGSVVIPPEVVKAETDQLMREAEVAKAVEKANREQVEKFRHGNGKRHNKK